MSKWWILAVVVVVVALVAYPIAFYNSKTTKVVAVDEKWVKYHNGDAKYLFSDTEGNVYSIEDSFWLWKWDASDRYAMIKTNETYEIITYGWRIRLLSWYTNAVEIEEKGGGE